MPANADAIDNIVAINSNKHAINKDNPTNITSINILHLYPLFSLRSKLKYYNIEALTGYNYNGKLITTTHTYNSANIFTYTKLHG